MSFFISYTADPADRVSVCGQVRLGRKISFDAVQWFSRYLSDETKRREVTCSLLRCDNGAGATEAHKDDKSRSSEEKSTASTHSDAKKGNGAGSDISFANTAQFLLLSLESVKALTQVI